MRKLSRTMLVNRSRPLQYMQSLGAATGVVPPPWLFAPPPPPPPHYSTPMSINVLVCMFMLMVKPSGVWKFYSCMVCIYLVSHMQSLLLCAESISGIERSSCFSESFTKSVSLAIWLRFLWLLMLLLFVIVVVDDGALGLLMNLFVIYCETCDVCDIYVVLVIYIYIYMLLMIYMWCWWCLLYISSVCLDVM